MLLCTLIAVISGIVLYNDVLQKLINKLTKYWLNGFLTSLNEIGWAFTEATTRNSCIIYLNMSVVSLITIQLLVSTIIYVLYILYFW